MKSSAGRGTGQLRFTSFMGTSSVEIVGRACAFGRYHRRAERGFRSAASSKSRALKRLLQPLQDQTGDAFTRLFDCADPDWKSLLGIESAVALAQPQPAQR